MGTIEVVDLAPVVEMALYIVDVLEAPRRNHLCSHRAVEAFFLAVGLWVCWPAVTQPHSQEDEPNAQLRHCAFAGISPRRTVIAVDAFWKPVALERRLQCVPHWLGGLRAKGLQHDV